MIKNCTLLDLVLGLVLGLIFMLVLGAGWLSLCIIIFH
jgi:hypothetical protein